MNFDMQKSVGEIENFVRRFKSGVYYMAHAYTGDEVANFERATICASRLVSLGYVIHSPVSHGYHFEARIVGKCWAMMMAFDRLFLESGNWAGLILCPGWEKSRGCFMEKKWFEDKNLPIYHYEDLVKETKIEKSQQQNDDVKKQLIAKLRNLEFYGHPEFYELLGKMADLHSRKNHDYAGEGGNPLRNFYKSKEQGVSPWRGVLLRLSDKWSRLESFCRQDDLKVKDESIEDTLLDNAVYSLITIILRREEKEVEKLNVYFQKGEK